jgi:hypothetical protein
MSSEASEIIYAENVALIQSYDSNSLEVPYVLLRDYLEFTGDVNSTIHLDIAQTRIIEERFEPNLIALFGCWLETGREEEALAELYGSRLEVSSPPVE